MLVRIFDLAEISKLLITKLSYFLSVAFQIPFQVLFSFKALAAMPNDCGHWIESAEDYPEKIISPAYFSGKEFPSPVN